MKILTILFIASILFLTSCDNNEVQKDMDKFCECRRAAQEGTRELSDCEKELDEILDKYQFDPEAVDVIKEKSKTCLNDSIH